MKARSHPPNPIPILNIFHHRKMIKSSIAVAVGVAVPLIVLVIIVVLACCCSRSRSNSGSASSAGSAGSAGILGYFRRGKGKKGGKGVGGYLQVDNDSFLGNIGLVCLLVCCLCFGCFLLYSHLWSKCTLYIYMHI